MLLVKLAFCGLRARVSRVFKGQQASFCWRSHPHFVQDLASRVCAAFCVGLVYCSRWLCTAFAQGLLRVCEWFRAGLSRGLRKGLRRACAGSAQHKVCSLGWLFVGGLVGTCFFVFAPSAGSKRKLLTKLSHLFCSNSSWFMAHG